MSYEVFGKCDECRDNMLVDEKVYCEKCYDKALSDIDSLEDNLSKQRDVIEELEAQIEILLDTPTLDRALFKEKFER